MINHLLKLYGKTYRKSYNRILKLIEQEEKRIEQQEHRIITQNKIFLICETQCPYKHGNYCIRNSELIPINTQFSIFHFGEKGVYTRGFICPPHSHPIGDRY